MAKKVSAHSATAAAEMQRLTGRLPAFSPKRATPAREAARLRAEAAGEAARSLEQDPSQDLPALKHSLCEKYRISFLRNSEILAHVPAQNRSLRALLLKSPTRTLSGVSPVAIMPPPSPCGGACIYCPKGENAPQSYTGYEPTTMRAIQNGYSASRQIRARLGQYSSQGHVADKCHLIIMGGTFLYGHQLGRHKFMKQAFEALNGKKSRTFAAAIDANESAPHRAIGVTFETRPDYGLEYHADEMLAMGGTQVELGVQALSDRAYNLARRGHTVADVIRSTRTLRDSGFKLLYHMMPGLFSTPSQDVSYFRKLFSGPRFQPDMLKIYPAMVLQGTELYRLWKLGRFEPYGTEQAAEVIADATRFIPPYVRVPRIQRDIPSPLVSAGVKNSNLRQIVDRKLSERGEKCRCIRCREIGSAERKNTPLGKLCLTLERLDYAASGGKEIFLSFEDKEKDLLASFLRLRIPGQSHRREIDSAAPAPGKYGFQSLPAPHRPAAARVRSHQPEILSSLVRELHVYGQEASIEPSFGQASRPLPGLSAIGEDSPARMQHKGLGRRLLLEAEEITKKEFGLSKISVLSGPGARGYYRKLGYSLDGPYMSKRI